MHYETNIHSEAFANRDSWGVILMDCMRKMQDTKPGHEQGGKLGYIPLCKAKTFCIPSYQAKQRDTSTVS